MKQNCLRPANNAPNRHISKRCNILDFAAVCKTFDTTSLLDLLIVGPKWTQSACYLQSMMSIVHRCTALLLLRGLPADRQTDGHTNTALAYVVGVIRFFTVAIAKGLNTAISPEPALEPASNVARIFFSRGSSSTQRIFTARCYASAVLAMALCLSVRLSVRPSQVGVLLKRLKVGSHKQHHTIPQGL